MLRVEGKPPAHTKAAHAPTSLTARGDWPRNLHWCGERVIFMFCGNGGNCLWIIIILILLFCCGGCGFGGNCGCNNCCNDCCNNNCCC